MSAPAMSAAARTISQLGRLYLVRFAFAAAWASACAAVGGSIAAGSTVFLILYPAFDAAAASFDFRKSGDRTLRVNIAISAAAATGLATTAADGVPAVLRAWGRGPTRCR